MPPQVTVFPLPSANPNTSATGPPEHHVGSPAQHYRNPWPSAKGQSLLNILHARFRGDRNFVPVPENRKELVEVRKPDWGWKTDPDGKSLKATWIGHASWLVETAIVPLKESKSAQENSNVSTDPASDESVPIRGVRILFDPVFSERTSPVQWMGPKRYTPTPCSLDELPEIDIVVISHNHYDHLDLYSIERLWKRNNETQFLCPLGNKTWFLSLGIGLRAENVTELDWWEQVEVDVSGIGGAKLCCTPAQHSSGRSPWDRDRTLWSSWVLEAPASGGSTAENGEANGQKSSLDNGASNASYKLYFAGDTGYRHVQQTHPTSEEENAQPVCPAFKAIGDAFGPVDLALLPIGLCTPRDFMSTVHCAPEDAVCVHSDVRSKKSIGMHYGTIRGGISAQYEDVREPPRRWKELCEKAGLKWGKEAGLCAIGETVFP